ncbi:MAG TPA: hypothetical protein VL442_17055 [Mucilaginibacter sp.]|jgi:hypothetical protein|nr:hypothetical protein [Mucilaginibacter sp.]
MKKIILSLTIALSSCCLYAQNTFLSSGDAILGAPGYIGNALQFQGSGEAHFIRTESIGNSGNGHTRLRMYLGDDWSYDQGFEIIANRWDGLQRSLFYLPGNGDNASFYSGASFGGNVGIGTTIPDAKLAVKGTIHTQEVKVDMSGWGDYVFDKDYSLKSLSSVKTYINQHHHLPEIPSATEIIKNGVNVGEMLKLQTKKIEELTLYLIEKDKQLSDQQQNIKSQQAQIDELREQLKSITKFHPQVGQHH